MKLCNHFTSHLVVLFLGGCYLTNKNGVQTCPEDTIAAYLSTHQVTSKKSGMLNFTVKKNIQQQALDQVSEMYFSTNSCHVTPGGKGNDARA